MRAAVLLQTSLLTMQRGSELEPPAQLLSTGMLCAWVEPLRQVTSSSHGMQSEMCHAPADSTSLGSLVSELDDAAPGDATPARDALRAVLAEVFNSHDFNKDGRMDVQEFRAAMRDMGDELSAKVSRCTVAARPCEAASVTLPPFAVHSCAAQT